MTDVFQQSAYDALYLADAQKHFASMMEYVVHDCALDADTFLTHFLISAYAKRFEEGDPRTVSGMSGIELAREVLRDTGDSLYQNEDFPQYTGTHEKSSEYWAGQVLAYYQWRKGFSFASIFRFMPFSEIVSLYPLYHEMDIERFCEHVEELRHERTQETNLKRLRRLSGLSQSALARTSGVGLRSIQMFEQRRNDIDKAQGHTLKKLALTLGVPMEALLEDPLSKS